jgi:hypothetical protein
VKHLLSFVLLALLAVGCSEDPPVVPPVDTEATVNYRIVARNIIPLRTGEYYSLWVKEAPDSAYRFISDTILHVYYPFDSSLYYGKFDVKYSIDSLKEVLLTIERTKKPTTPGVVVLRGTVEKRFDSVLGKDSIYSVLENISFDSMLYTSGMLTFTSKSPDPEAYTKEFYFLRFAGPTFVPSIESLPLPPTGWNYATWTYDNDFFPAHQFLYGLFNTATGHDSDSANDAYEFPGGAKSQPQDVGTGLIIVTLEPQLYGDSLRYAGPSPIRILQFERRRVIIPDQAYTMDNAAIYSLPTMSISFKKK